jgi:hypothetical protein
MAHGTDQISDLITSTLRAFEKSGIVQDTIFSADPLLSMLFSKGKKKVEGGTDIQVNLRYGKNTNVASYNGADTLGTGEIDTLGHARFGWKQYSGSFWVPELELLQNSGNTTKVVDLWREKMEVTTLSLQDKMIADLYDDGTGNSGKELLGLKAVLSATGILGGIDRSLATWWVPNVTDYTGVTDTKPTLSRIKAKIRKIRGPQGRPDKAGKVDMILVNGDMYDYISDLVDAKNVGTNLGGPVAQLGFDAIKIAGCEVTWSENVPAGEIWYISTEYLGLRVMPGRDFYVSDAIKGLVNNVDTRKAFILWAGNLTVSNCRYLGKDLYTL